MPKCIMKKRRRVALRAAGFFKAQANEISGGEDIEVAVERLQASGRYDDALCMLCARPLLAHGAGPAIVQLGG